MKKLIITTGDVDGIGFEVAAKALSKIGPQDKICFYLFRTSSSSPKDIRRYKNKFTSIAVASLEEAHKLSAHRKSNFNLVELVSNTSPALWVESSAQACIKGLFDGLITAPLSKQEIRKAGLKDLGHTDILKRICSSPNAFMGFKGDCFNVLLATGHLPLSKVPQSLTEDLLFEAIIAANNFRKKLKSKLPLALLGLNPHAGDQGLIGKEELFLFKKVLHKAKINKIPVVGTLVPDAAFNKVNWSRFSVFITCYHDQGLIPFKTVHGFDSGVHLTLGLPIMRTSVDHGTAKDIFGKNIANPNSMIQAIEWAIKH